MARRNFFIKCGKCSLVFIYFFLWGLALLNKNPRVEYVMPPVFHTSFSRSAPENSSHQGNFCRLNWDKLQHQRININEESSMESVINQNRQVRPGGAWSPSVCTPFQRVAIIVPYRNRRRHLILLLRILHPMLRRQKIYYRIFVMEQGGSELFNRGILFNLGVQEALMRDAFDCFIFHDVDMIPEHNRNVYLCDNHVRHLSSAIDEMRYHVMYSNYAGGVVAINKANMFKVNGFSNIYWGWGNEDDDFSARTMAAGLMLTRPPEYIGRYKMVRHRKADRSNNGYEYFRGFRGRQYKEGLNSLVGANYQILHVSTQPLYTNITVNLVKPAQLTDDTWPETRESVWWFLKFYGWI